jgi:hypothetical protein
VLACGNGRVYEIHFRAGRRRWRVKAACGVRARSRPLARSSIASTTAALGFDRPDLAAALEAAGRGRQYPNPFNLTTTISFTPSASDVRLAVYDARCREVRRLLAVYRSAGENAVVWDGRDEAGRTLPSGVYVYRVSAGDLESAGRMLLVK